MTDISVHSTAYQVEDRSWLLSPHGTDPGTTPSITLDISGFTSGTHFPNGFIKSGEALAETAEGLFIPYVESTTEVGTLTRTSTAGDVRLNIHNLATGEGGLTGEIPATAAGFTAAAYQAAIRALGGAFATATVTGADGGPLTVTFVGQGGDIAVEVDNDDATGGTVVWATTVAGGAESPAGEGVGKGLLLSTVKVPDTADTTINVGGALLVHGFVKVSKLPRDPGAAFWADTPLIHHVA